LSVIHNLELLPQTDQFFFQMFLDFAVVLIAMNVTEFLLVVSEINELSKA